MYFSCRHRCVSTRILLSQGRPRLLSERLRCLGEKRASQLGSVNRKSGIHPCVYASSASLLTRLLCYKRPLDEKPASCPASCMFRNLMRSLNIWDHIIDRFRNPGKKSANPGSGCLFSIRIAGGWSVRVHWSGLRFRPAFSRQPPRHQSHRSRK